MTDLPSPLHDPDACPPCPVCGAALEIDWVDVTSVSQWPRRDLLPANMACSARIAHDVRPVVHLFDIVTVVHLDRAETASCPLYLLDRWRDKGWFPTSLNHQTPTETVEHRVWTLKQEGPAA